MLFGMMVILDVGSISVTNTSPVAGMAMVMVFVVIMLLSILLTLLNGGYQYFQQKYRKRFRFFTCHQKNAAGSMARFLGKGQDFEPSISNTLSGYCKDNMMNHDSLQGWETPKHIVCQVIGSSKVPEDGTGTTQPLHQDLYRLL